MDDCALGWLSGCGMFHVKHRDGACTCPWSLAFPLLWQSRQRIYRYNHGLQTIITANYGLKALAERMVMSGKDRDSGNDVQSRRILSRICGMCHIVEIRGKDFRMQQSSV